MNFKHGIIKEDYERYVCRNETFNKVWKSYYPLSRAKQLALCYFTYAVTEKLTLTANENEITISE